MTTLLLIHGGLWEGMNAERFWHKPGIVTGLQGHGLTVLAPDRLPKAQDWAAEVDHLAPALPDHLVTVLAGSTGCSVAVRLALTFPDRVARLLLAWPATAGDPGVDARTRGGLAELGASPAVINALLTGQTLRGVTDAELASLSMPVGVLPEPINDALSTLCARSCHMPANCPAVPKHPGRNSRQISNPS